MSVVLMSDNIASVESIDAVCVNCGQARLQSGILNMKSRISWRHRFHLAMHSERSRTVQHDRVVVKYGINSFIVFAEQLKIGQKSWIDVFPMDVQKIVTIVSLM